jgi:hypothetical protein
MSTSNGVVVLGTMANEVGVLAQATRRAQRQRGEPLGLAPNKRGSAHAGRRR